VTRQQTSRMKTKSSSLSKCNYSCATQPADWIADYTVHTISGEQSTENSRSHKDTDVGHKWNGQKVETKTQNPNA